MKAFLFAFVVLSFTAHAQKAADEKPKAQVVEASCGQCNFGLKGGGCSLAIRMDGKAYFVDGATMKEHGDEHGEGGMCNTIRKATVEGEVVEGRYKATSFVLLPVEKKEVAPKSE